MYIYICMYVMYIITYIYTYVVYVYICSIYIINRCYILYMYVTVMMSHAHLSQRIFLSLPWCHLRAMRISWDILIRGGFPPGTASVAKHPVQSTNNKHIQTSKNYHEESWTIMKNHELSWRIMTIMNCSYDQKNHWLRWMVQRNPRNHQFWMIETLSRMGCSGHIGHSAGASLESTYFNGISVLY